MIVCSECKVEFDPRATGTWQEVTGWLIQNERHGTASHGQAASIRDRKPTGAYLCPDCGTLRKLGIDTNQGAMF